MFVWEMTVKTLRAWACMCALSFDCPVALTPWTAARGIAISMVRHCKNGQQRFRLGLRLGLVISMRNRLTVSGHFAMADL